jgi:hypothetical protein
VTLLSTRIVEGEKIAIQAPSKEFGERVKEDKVLTKEYVDLSNHVTKFFSEALADTPIILADNVTDYLYGIQAHDSNAKWDLRDLPVVVPPFRGVFVETASPRHFDNPDIRGWGAIFSRIDEVEAIEPGEIEAEAVKWIVEMALVYDDRGSLRTYPAIWLFYLDNDGRLFRDAAGNILYETATLVGPELAGTVDGNERWEALKESVMTLVLPFFYTFAFCHCRTVDVQQREVSRQVRRQAERKGLPLLDYRVLEIEPMKKALKSEGGIEEVGPTKALHICRGHFKTYTEDAPLFGQHIGTWWWEGSIRGSLSRGNVDKDYSVTPPADRQ